MTMGESHGIKHSVKHHTVFFAFRAKGNRVFSDVFFRAKTQSSFIPQASKKRCAPPIRTFFRLPSGNGTNKKNLYYKR